MKFQYEMCSYMVSVEISVIVFTNASGAAAIQDVRVALTHPRASP